MFGSHSVGSLKTHLWHLSDATFPISLYESIQSEKQNMSTKSLKKNPIERVKRKKENKKTNKQNGKSTTAKQTNTYPVPTLLHNYITEWTSC